MIAAQVDLLALASQYLELKRVSATEHAGPCPFCNAGTDRFRIWPETGRYWCRKCDSQGDAYQFCKEHLSMSHDDILTTLGRSSERSDVKRVVTYQEREVKQARPKPASPEAINSLARLQTALPGSVGERYLAARGISLTTAQIHGLGYQEPGQHRPLSDSQNGRVIIPHTKPGGAVCNLYGRTVDTRTSRADKKYRHRHLSGDKGVFNARELSEAVVFVCEGPFDALSLLEAGYPAVAVFGLDTARLTWFRAQHVVLCLDNDEAGKASMQEWGQSVMQWGMSPHKLDLPDGCKDLNQAAMRGGLDVLGQIGADLHLLMMASYYGCHTDGPEYAKLQEAASQGLEAYRAAANDYKRRLFAGFPCSEF